MFELNILISTSQKWWSVRNKRNDRNSTCKSSSKKNPHAIHMGKVQVVKKRSPEQHCKKCLVQKTIIQFDDTNHANTGATIQ